MRYIVNSREMQTYDKNTIEKYHVPSLVLMERAALACVHTIYEKKLAPDKILVVCGGGNNGGDGYAIARLLWLDGYEVDVVTADVNARETEANRLQREIWQAYGREVFTAIPKDTVYALVVDAVFGVGLSRDVEGKYAELLRQMNALSGIKLAVDIPSGISADNGAVLGTAFHADMTVTFAFEKIGTILWPGNAYAGEVLVREIGIDEKSFLNDRPKTAALEDCDLVKLPLHQSHSNKGTFGRLLVIAGCAGMSGAAYLSAKAAYSCGCGLVRIFTVEENRVILQTQLPEAIITTYDEETFDAAQLESVIAWADAVVCGPGIGTSAVSEEIVRMVLKAAAVPVVLDADALNIVAQDAHAAYLLRTNPQLVLTPHLGEMHRLCGKSVAELQMQLLETAEAFAEQYQVVCVLKDEHTVIRAPKGQTYLNLSGNAGMATAGSGDVLSGVIGSLLAQGMSLSDAPAFGVYLHGRAGDVMAERYGKSGLMASDLTEGLRVVLCEHER